MIGALITPVFGFAAAAEDLRRNGKNSFTFKTIQKSGRAVAPVQTKTAEKIGEDLVTNAKNSKTYKAFRTAAYVANPIIAMATKDVKTNKENSNVLKGIKIAAKICCPLLNFIDK